MRPSLPMNSDHRLVGLLGLAGILLLATACGRLPSGLPGVGGPTDDSSVATPAIVQGNGGDDGGLNDSELPPPAAAACPSEAQQAVLFISHSFDWAPNRDKSVAEINGQTDASAPCPLTINGTSLSAGPCRVPYTNTGVIHGSDGDCQVQGQGQAEVTIEGSCDQGKLTLTITEMPADESPGATMTCPNTSAPYVTYYPPSLTTRTFQIQVGGAEASEDADPDMTNQFSYHKTWSLHVEGLDSPLPDN